MFERFTEKARRAVSFARYEASQYGNSYIETEHLLLGLWREDLALRGILDDPDVEQPSTRGRLTDSEFRAAVERVLSTSDIRAAIEQHITRRPPISTSIEVPLSADSKKALLFASEEAERLGHRHVGTEHMLLGILRVEDSLAAQIVRGRGLTPEKLRERLVKRPQPVSFSKPSLPILEEFLRGLKWFRSCNDLMSCLAKNVQVVDVHGKRWSYEEIAANFETLFAPYAKKNATYIIEQTVVDSSEHLVTMVLWKNALLASMERVWMHRMTVVLVPQGDEWAIVSMHMTPVQP
jgi:hypothetical protein